VPFYIIFWTYKTAQRIDSMAMSRGLSSDMAILSLILEIFVPIIPPILLQDKLNAIATAGNADAESRVDYLADILGIEKDAVIESINLMRQEGLLEDYSDMSAYIYDSDSQHKSTLVLDRFSKLERFILSKITDEGASFGFKELNEEAQNEGITTSNVKNIRTILHYLTIKNYVTKEENRDSFSVNLVPSLDLKRLMDKFERRIEICRFILGELYSKATPDGEADAEKKPVEFSLVGLFKAYQAVPRMDVSDIPVALSDVEDALLYLSKIGALKLEGGFLVLYNGMEIKRIVKDNRIYVLIGLRHTLNKTFPIKIVTSTIHHQDFILYT
jgi:ATP-dependent DNA helicase RecQ